MNLNQEMTKDVLILPTMISFIIGFSLTETEYDIDIFPDFVMYFQYVSLFGGIAILLEIISPKRNQNRVLLRLISGGILIFSRVFPLSNYTVLNIPIMINILKKI